MAISHRLLTSGASTTLPYGTGSITTATFTPANNSLLVVLLGVVDDGGGSVASSLTVSGGGLTYTARITNGRTGGYKAQTRCWTAPVTTGASMSITFDCGAYSIVSYGWAVIEVTGYNTTTPTGGTASSTSDTADGAVSTTLSAAPSSEDYTIGMIWVDGDTSGTIGVTPGSTYTEIGEFGGTTAAAYGQVQYCTGSTSATADWQDIRTGTMVTYSHASQSIVIKAASGGTPATSLVPASISRKMAHLLGR